MNLVIDQGNTSIKAAVFHNGEIVFNEIIPLDSLEYILQTIKSNYPISHCIVSSVGKSSDEIADVLKNFVKVHKLTAHSKTPFQNRYSTPHSLGVDRIALAAAAKLKYPKKNCLIIDAGTCITYDFLNANSEYLGGSISPGVHMRYRAMHQLTAKLPLLQPVTEVELIGKTTEAAMHSGVLLGIVNEVDGVIDSYRERFSDLTVILTGGDGDFFGKRLKNSIFAHSKFLLEGLNFLLDYNKQ